MNPDAMFHNFIQFCCQHAGIKDILTLHHMYLSSHPASVFALSEFFAWKRRVLARQQTDDFYAYPFLQDELFLLRLRSASISMTAFASFEDLIHQQQVAHYREHIDPAFPSSSSSTNNSGTIVAPPSCPFATRRTHSPSQKIVLGQQLDRVAYAQFSAGSVHYTSDLASEHTVQLAQSTLKLVGLVRPSQSRLRLAAIGTRLRHLVIPGGLVAVDLKTIAENGTLLFVADTARIQLASWPTSDVIDDATIRALISVRSHFSPADLVFLFGRAMRIAHVAPGEVNRLLHLLLYAEALSRSADECGITRLWPCGQPSALEPYADSLTADFVISNGDLLHCPAQ